MATVYVMPRQEVCRKCGGIGFAEDEFLNQWNGLCRNCQPVANNPPPPVGPKPEWIAIEHRIMELSEAIGRCQQANHPIREEWNEERQRCFAALAQAHRARKD